MTNAKPPSPNKKYKTDQPQATDTKPVEGVVSDNSTATVKPTGDNPSLPSWKSFAGGIALGASAGILGGDIAAKLTEPADLQQKTAIPDKVYTQQLPNAPKFSNNGEIIASTKAEEELRRARDNLYKRRAKAISEEQDRKLKIIGQSTAMGAITGGTLVWNTRIRRKKGSQAPSERSSRET